MKWNEIDENLPAPLEGAVERPLRLPGIGFIDNLVAYGLLSRGQAGVMKLVDVPDSKSGGG
jgi:hypothetical protein